MTTTIGFIGGGQMAEALIRGIIQAELYPPEQILITEPDASRREYMKATYNTQLHETDHEIWNSCSTVILAVKPQVMQIVLDKAKGRVTSNHLLISIAAGLPISFYEEILGQQPRKIIRVMPNTPALVLECAAALCGNPQVSDEELQQAKAIFDAVGQSVILSETSMDAVTGLSGSGPAYVFTFIEGMIDAGVKCGLTRPVATTLAIQTVLGSTKLMLESKKHPAELRAMVTSPGGTTIAAQQVLERTGFRGIIMEAIEAAANRSAELGTK
ncbi:MAG: pyrroline-5-carboxylate reductase [Desulfobulbaceae bacterium]|uniref:Pyrroline-5-carboxylate reductase n=1 Tax=Candidatus Desulfatifera sulfidica TaxID=2841691 RepID=A0A8J6TEG4_9BACT|nr:pyrroline-5-carboxylate reductase [Candidatus Desulfatifera sulfidica]